MPLTVERLKALLDYDRATGVFTSRVYRGPWTPGKKVGWRNSNGYIRIRIDGEDYGAHRLAWLYVYGEWPPGDLDHKDTVRSNNRIGNLRPATDNQNAWNTRLASNNTSGFKGVRKVGSRWHARIARGGKLMRLGSFDTAEDAHAAYCYAASILFGDFARPSVTGVSRDFSAAPCDAPCY